MSIYTLLKVGTDAELFVRSSFDQEPIPIIGRLGGTKQEPKNIKELGVGYAVQEDNVMAEFNVPPSDSAMQFAYSIRKMLFHLEETLGQQDLDLAIEASMEFRPTALTSAQAKTFGCDPDLCAWTQQFNKIDKENPVLATLRTAAAHIHVSYLIDGLLPTDALQRVLAVKAHDLFVGVPSVLLDPDKKRRQIYGKAGAFRITDYGHEYRTPSNFWIKSSDLSRWVFNQTKKALEFISTADGRYILEEDQETMSNIQGCINSHDLAMAAMLCQQHDIELPA